MRVGLGNACVWGGLCESKEELLCKDYSNLCDHWSALRPARVHASKTMLDELPHVRRMESSRSDSSVTDATMVTRSVHNSQQQDSQPDWSAVGAYSFLKKRWEHAAVWDDDDDDGSGCCVGGSGDGDDDITKERLPCTSQTSDRSPLRRSSSCAKCRGWHAASAVSATAKELHSFLEAFELSLEQDTRRDDGADAAHRS